MAKDTVAIIGGWWWWLVVVVVMIIIVGWMDYSVVFPLVTRSKSYTNN